MHGVMECGVGLNAVLKSWLSKNGAKGGKKSRRKLTKKEARRIAMVRWAAGAGGGCRKESDEEGQGS